MRYIKLTPSAEFIAFDILSVCDVLQVKEGACLLIDVQTGKYMSPSTDGKWEKMDNRANTCESAHLMQ